MLFVLFTGLIAILCVFALIKTYRDKNWFAAGFSAIALIVFGFFSIMEVLDELGIFSL